MIGKVLSGKEFNELYKDNTFYKLTNDEENHNGFQFKDGMNVDNILFNPTKKCSPGGIYFTEYDKIPIWIEYGDNVMYWIRKVVIPDNAQVYIEDYKFKADFMYLGERKSIWDDDELCMLAVQQNGWALQYVKEQTLELCKLAVQQNEYALYYVKKQTPELCELAVQKNGFALEYVKEQTPEICKLAVQEIGYALEYVKEQTPELCMLAVQKDGLALEFVKEQTPEYVN